jgi:hypothetical protein
MVAQRHNGAQVPDRMRTSHFASMPGLVVYCDSGNLMVVDSTTDCNAITQWVSVKPNAAYTVKTRRSQHET